MNVLIIDDEPKIAQVLADYFAQAHFDCTLLHDGGEAVELIRREAPDFVVLDLMLPGKDGLTICREVRQFSQVPILMLTAKVEEIDRLLGLELGADDYVCKPFSPREVVARAKTILRRVNQTPDAQPERLVYGDIEVFEDRFVCRVRGEDVELTPVEFRILGAMLAAPRRVFSRDNIMHAAYDDGRIVSERTIDSHMRNLRNKLQEHTDDDVIRSIYGVGYKL